MIGRLLPGFTATVMALSAAHAADIKLEGKNADGVTVVSINGDFVAPDIERFADVTKDLADAIISFNSDGGNLSAGIEIGTRIRLRGYRTVVADREECYSACALAWLGGTTRYVGRGAQIGFHAAYLEKDGRFQETGVGNAVVGGYAANLGLGTSAIIFLTSAPPEAFNALTEALAQRVGITAEFIDSQNLVDVSRFLTGANDSEMLEQLRMAAEQGDPDAQMDLGIKYAYGQGVRQDHTEAARWYRLAAEQGDALAQTWLGDMYTRGNGVRQDYGEAVRLFWLAAEQGYAHAQNNLGAMYHNGQGVRQDHAEAVHWFRLAAEQGYAHAQYNLGLSYAAGEGIPQESVLAHMWLNLAAAQGNEDAGLNRDRIARQMSSAQIAEAQRLAHEWRPTSR